MTDAPPSDVGADQDRDTSRSARVADNDVGTPGIVAGVAFTVDDGPPVPAALVADTRNVYSVPFVSPVTVAEVVLERLSENVDQLVPPSGEYSIT